MTTNLTSGTQISIDPSILPIDWQPGQSYTIILNEGFVTESDNNKIPSARQTSTFTTFSTVPSVSEVDPPIGASGIYTSTVSIAYQRNIQLSTNTNFYLYSGTNLIATISGNSTRVKAQSKSNSKIVSNVQQIIPLNTTTEIYNHIQMEFKPVNTASFLTNILPSINRGLPYMLSTDSPDYGGTEFQLYFNDLLLPDGNVVGQNPTYYKYFVIPAGQPVYFNTGTKILTEDKFYIQAWRLNKSNNQPNQYGDQTEPVQPKIFAEWASLSTGTIKIPYSTVVYSTLTNKQILIDLTGYILPNTHYHINADEGIVYDMFKFLTPSASNILDWTSGEGPSIVDYTPSYNAIQNVSSATLKFSKTVILNTGNFYLKNDLGTIRIIPVISTSVSLLNTNTVSINIGNTPTPEDSYHITWDQGVVIDTNSIAIYAVEDGTPLRFYDQIMTGLSVRQCNRLTPTNIFTSQTFTHLSNSYSVGVPQIIEAGTGTYELRLSSPFGVFNHPTLGTTYATYWSLSGSPAYINSKITEITFTPQESNGQDSTYEWKLLRNNTVIYDQIFDLYGEPYQLPIAIPDNPNNISPSNISTLTLTIGSTRVINEPVAFTANINSYLDLGGQVQFKVNNTVIATVDMTTSGVASTTTIFGTTGTRSISAIWLGGLLSNGYSYQPLISNTASVYIDSAAQLPFRILTPVTPFTRTTTETFVAQAFTSTIITGNVLWTKANAIATGTVVTTTATFYFTSTYTLTNTLLDSSIYRFTTATTTTSIVGIFTAVPLTITTMTSAVISRYAPIDPVNRPNRIDTYLQNPTITVTDLSNPLLKVGNNLTLQLTEYTNLWYLPNYTTYIGTSTTITQVESSFTILNINSSTKTITLGIAGINIGKQWTKSYSDTTDGPGAWPTYPPIAKNGDTSYMSAVGSNHYLQGQLGVVSAGTNGAEYFDVFSRLSFGQGYLISKLGVTTTGTTDTKAVYFSKWTLVPSYVTTATKVDIVDNYVTIKPTYYNTQTLGTTAFVNNTATLVNDPGTFTAGTYTIFASWTGTNIIPKYYAITTSTIVTVQNP
jgi:hypothetical protein